MATGALLALTAVSAGMSIVQGIQQSNASSEAGVAYMRQAQIAQQENQLAVEQKRREIDKVAARQVMAMAKNGMDTGRGSPLEILYETAYLGQQEIDMLRLQGNAQVQSYRDQSNAAFNSGRASILGGVSSAITTVATKGISAKTAGIGSAVQAATPAKQPLKTNIGDFSTYTYSGLINA